MSEIIAKIAKFNFWGGDIPETGILRKAYLGRISDFIGTKLVKVLTGQRRAGKSYLLRQIIHQLVESGAFPSQYFYKPLWYWTCYQNLDSELS